MDSNRIRRSNLDVFGLTEVLHRSGVYHRKEEARYRKEYVHLDFGKRR